MSKLISDSTFSGGLTKFATSNALHVCQTDPADRAAVIANSLASGALTGGDFSEADGDVSGRKVTVAQQADLSITQTGTAATICLIDATELLAKTDVANSQTLTSGGTVTVNAWKWEIADPA